jgi:hypothetical protein
MNYSDPVLTFLNTPQRLDRINRLTVSTDLKFFSGRNHVVFTVSEEILIEPDTLHRIDAMIVELIKVHKDEALTYIEDILIRFIRSMLVFCVIKFKDEDIAHTVTTADEVVQIDEGNVLVFEIEKKV